MNVSYHWEYPKTNTTVGLLPRPKRDIPDFCRKCGTLLERTLPVSPYGRVICPACGRKNYPRRDFDYIKPEEIATIPPELIPPMPPEEEDEEEEEDW